MRKGSDPAPVWVWVVRAGHEICGVYSTREKAVEAVGLLTIEFRLERYEVNPWRHSTQEG